MTVIWRLPHSETVDLFSVDTTKNRAVKTGLVICIICRTTVIATRIDLDEKVHRQSASLVPKVQIGRATRRTQDSYEPVYDDIKRKRSK